MKSIRDFNGKHFRSICALCEYYNITTDKFNRRIKDGWTLKDALTKPSNYSPTYPINKKLSVVLKTLIDTKSNEFINRKSVFVHFTYDNVVYNVISDHEGNIFKSISAMCKYYGISEYRFKYKVAYKGMKNALCGGIKDHKGNEFRSYSEMWRYYGITKQTAEYRKSQGWSIEKILTTPVNHNKNHYKYK